MTDHSLNRTLEEILKRPKKYIHEEVTMKIIGDHPHAGELCNPVGDDKSKVGCIWIGQTEMFEVKLLYCSHGVEGAFVPRKNLLLIQGPQKANIITGDDWKKLEKFR